MVRRSQIVEPLSAALRANDGTPPPLILEQPAQSMLEMLLAEHGHDPYAATIAMASLHLFLCETDSKARKNDPEGTAGRSGIPPFSIFKMSSKDSMITMIREQLDFVQLLRLWQIYTGAPDPPAHLLSFDQMVNMLTGKGCRFCSFNNCTGECLHV